MNTEITTIQKGPVPLLVKTREVASLLSVSLQTVHNLIQSGELKASEISPAKNKARKHVRITQKSLLHFYKKRFGHSLIDALKNQFDPASAGAQ